MTTPEIIAQILGVLLIIVCAISPQMKTKSGMILFNVIGNVIWAVQFVFLDAKAGLWVGTISIVRSIVFYIYAIKEKRAPAWIVVAFLIFMVSSVIYAWHGWYCIFLIFGCLYTYGQWQQNKAVYRTCIAIATLSNGMYLIATGGFTGALNEFIQTASASIALWRFRKGVVAK